jgi:MscS family membrane protein
MNMPLIRPQQGAEEVAQENSLADLIREKLGPPESLLRKSDFLIENWQWLGLLLLIFLGLVLERLVSAGLRRLGRKAAGSDKVLIDEKRMTGFVRPFGVMVTWWVFVRLLPQLDIRNEVVDSALAFLGSVILSLAGIVAAWRGVDLFCDFLRARAEKTQNKFDDMLVPLLRRTLKIFVVLAGIAYVASRSTDDLWTLLAGLSIGGAVLAFAFKDSLENVFGTFTVLLDKPFQLGDWITVQDVDGTVEGVGFRSTRVRTFYNSVITVPNNTFINAKVDNWGARRYRRIRTILGLSYSTPPEKVEAFCEGVREVIRRHPYTRKDYYHVYLVDFGENALEVLLYAFVETPDWSMELREKHRLMADILRVAEKLGIEFAFPTRTLHMIQGDAEKHDDRPGSDSDGARLGREVGAEVADQTLAPFGGSRPGKVKFIQSSSPLAAGGDEDEN